MRKTFVLFGLALSLLFTALILGLPRQRPRTPPTAPAAPASPEARASTVVLGETVLLDGALSGRFVEAGRPGTLALLMDLSARREDTGRTPLAVAVVIDRSGSMAGEKMQQVRRAAKDLVARLADEDRVAIVSYASDYAVDLPLTRLGGERPRIQRIIDELIDGGGTNLSGGLSAGIGALRGAGLEHAACRVLLLSDGNANQGLTDPLAIAELAAEARAAGITVSTLGVGVDFNEDLMTLVAQRAGGGYYYARDGQAITRAFDRELAGLAKLAARGVEVQLELAPGVVVREVFGYRVEWHGDRVVIPVGDMASGEKRRVLAILDVGAAAPGAVDLAAVGLAYNTRQGARRYRAQLGVTASEDGAQVAAGQRRVVVEAQEAALAAQAREVAAAEFGAGSRATAITSLERQLQETRRKNISLKSRVLEEQVVEMEEALRSISAFSSGSEAGKDLVKSEKLRARQVFAY